MRSTAVVLLLVLTLSLVAAEVESRQLTHYVPQDLLETVVRTEKWTEVSLKLTGGGDLRKGDLIRIWAGGSIDHGNGGQPGQNVAGPDGSGIDQKADVSALALSNRAEDAFALLFKLEGEELFKSPPTGKPLDIKLSKEKEKLFVGFNDEKGRYIDNHLGKGPRYELDPLWVRIEVIRIIVD